MSNSRVVKRISTRRAAAAVLVAGAAAGTGTIDVDRLTGPVRLRFGRQHMTPSPVYSLRGRARLVLVTCGGPFNRTTGHYRDNIVVTAVPV